MPITDENKHEHPLFSKIPQILWKTHFNSQYDQIELLLPEHFNQIKRFDLPNAPDQALIILLVNYPKARVSEIQKLIDFSTITAQNIFNIGLELGRVDILQTLEHDSDSLKTLIRASNYQVFAATCANGYLDVLKWLKKQAPTELGAMFIAQPPPPAMVRFINKHKHPGFKNACFKGHLHILDWLEEQFPDTIKSIIESDYTVFIDAAQNKMLPILKWLQQRVSKKFLESDLIFLNIFTIACREGNLVALEWLATVNSSKLSHSIKSNHYEAVQCAAKKGHLDCLKFMANQATQELLLMIQAKNYVAFREACKAGHVNICKWLAEQAPQDILAMIQSENYDGFQYAFIRGHFEIVQWHEEVAAADLSNLLKTINETRFLSLCDCNNPSTLRWFMQHAPSEQLERLISYQNFRVFWDSALRKNQAITDMLLRHPGCFACAVQYDHPALKPFVAARLTFLEKESSENIMHPNQALFYYLLAKYLINFKQPLIKEKLDFILKIPSVAALAQQNIRTNDADALQKDAICKTDKPVSELSDPSSEKKDSIKHLISQLTTVINRATWNSSGYACVLFPCFKKTPAGIVRMRLIVNSTMDNTQKIKELQVIAEERLKNPPKFTKREEQVHDLYEKIKHINMNSIEENTFNFFNDDMGSISSSI